MKKMYVSPAMEVASMLAPEEMLAASIGKFKEPTIPGEIGYAKKDSWDIFGEETVEE